MYDLEVERVLHLHISQMMRRASTGRGGKGNSAIFPVSRTGQRNGTRVHTPPATPQRPRLPYPAGGVFTFGAVISLPADENFAKPAAR